MMESLFHIGECKNGSVLVTILTNEMSSVYWESLTDSISEMNVRNCQVVFDFLMRNGLDDRFYETYTNESSKICVSLKRIEATPFLVETADSFFVTHKKYIEKSALTKRQKSAFLALLKV